jgi:hypothetical protein
LELTTLLLKGHKGHKSDTNLILCPSLWILVVEVVVDELPLTAVLLLVVSVLLPLLPLTTPLLTPLPLDAVLERTATALPMFSVFAPIQASPFRLPR